MCIGVGWESMVLGDDQPGKGHTSSLFSLYLKSKFLNSILHLKLSTLIGFSFDTILF